MKKNFILTAIAALCCMAFAQQAQAQISANAFVTVWTADANNGIVFPGMGSGYTIQVYDAAGTTLLQTLTGNGTTTISNLTAGDNYTVAVTPGSGSFTGFGSGDSYYDGFTDNTKFIASNAMGYYCMDILRIFRMH